MNLIEFYVVTLAILAAINAITVIGLNVQFGTAGLLNLAYIVLLAIGAYATGIAALPPSPSHGYITYIGGFGWVFPWDLLFGMAVTVACGAFLGIMIFSRVSVWYLAVALTSIGYGLLTVINDEPRIFNGYIGLVNVPGPWESQLSQSDFQLVFLGISLLCLAAVLALTWRLERSPLGRAWRTVREDETAAMALGKNPLVLKMSAFALGSLAAGLAGGLTVLFLGAWNTEAWQPNETFLVLAAVIVGGRGWTIGGVVGSLVIYDLLIEGSKYLPVLGGRNELLPAIQTLFLGLIVLAMLWWRPYGLLPEPKAGYRAARGSLLRAGRRRTAPTPVPPVD